MPPKGVTALSRRSRLCRLRMGMSHSSAPSVAQRRSSVVCSSPAGMLAALFMGLCGPLIGSFANVVISESPPGGSIVKPASACPKCGERGAFSGQCPRPVPGYCCEGSAGPAKGPSLAATPGGGAGGPDLRRYWWRFGLSWTGLGEAALSGGLVVLAFIDLEHLLLPRRIVYVHPDGRGRGLRCGSCYRVVNGTGWLVAAISSFRPPLGTRFSPSTTSHPKPLALATSALALLIGFGLGWLGGGLRLSGLHSGQRARLPGRA